MRKQFNLQDWLKDKSQRVETRDGRIVHDIWPAEPLIVCGKRVDVCALIDGEEDTLVFFEGGKYLPANAESPFDLFIVTPEEELTDFEDAFGRAMMEVPEPEEKEEWYPFLKEKAAELLALAIDARVKELSEGLNQSKLDKDSIPYHLIEFMCNLYTSRNWKEIEETAELYVTRIKAAALKDLPRWKKAKEYIKLGPDDFCFTLDSNGKTSPYYDTEIEKGQYYITESDIENLPKED